MFYLKIQPGQTSSFGRVCILNVRCLDACPCFPVSQLSKHLWALGRMSKCSANWKTDGSMEWLSSVITALSRPCTRFFKIKVLLSLSIVFCSYKEWTMFISFSLCIFLECTYMYFLKIKRKFHTWLHTVFLELLIFFSYHHDSHAKAWKRPLSDIHNPASELGFKPMTSSPHIICY